MALDWLSSTAHEKKKKKEAALFSGEIEGNVTVKIYSPSAHLKKYLCTSVETKNCPNSSKIKKSPLESISQCQISTWLYSKRLFGCS